MWKKVQEDPVDPQQLRGRRDPPPDWKGAAGEMGGKTRRQRCQAKRRKCFKEGVDSSVQCCQRGQTRSDLKNVTGFGDKLVTGYLGKGSHRRRGAPEQVSMG